MGASDIRAIGALALAASSSSVRAVRDAAGHLDCFVPARGPVQDECKSCDPLDALAMREIETGRRAFRAGDHVCHRPTGEIWVIAYVDGDALAWCGWPAGEAKVSDCDLVHAADLAAHMRTLKACAKSDGKRARMARAALAIMGEVEP